MNKFSISEKLSFILFCVFNAILSLNCASFFTSSVASYVDQKQLMKPKKQTFVPTVSMHNVHTVSVQSGKKRHILFNFKDGRSMCRVLKTDEFYHHLYFGSCEKDFSALKIQTELVYFPARLDLPSDFFQSPSPVLRFSHHDSENLLISKVNGSFVDLYDWGSRTSFRLIHKAHFPLYRQSEFVPDSYKIISIMEDQISGIFAIIPEKTVFQKSYIFDVSVSDKREEEAPENLWIWGVILPAILLDIVTSPIQFLIYIRK